MNPSISVSSWDCLNQPSYIIASFPGAGVGHRSPEHFWKCIPIITTLEPCFCLFHRPPLSAPRRLIEGFGLNCFIGQIPRQIVFASTEDTFRLKMAACAYDLLELLTMNLWDSGALKGLYDTC
jgi:hypothetical protein